jgi:large subunit ribosomal protein L10Ae
MQSKINNAGVLQSITEMKQGTKPRKFVQTVEMQVSLKDYDPQKDKRFSGSVRLPNVARPKLRICLIAD